jgi:hypothetical protein
VPLLGGLALLVLFVWLQRRSAHPALDVTLFRNPAFSAAAAALGLNFFALMGATFYLVYYLQGVLALRPAGQRRGAHPHGAGHGGHGAGQLAAGRAVRRQGRRRRRLRLLTAAVCGFQLLDTPRRCGCCW